MKVQMGDLKRHGQQSGALMNPSPDPLMRVQMGDLKRHGDRKRHGSQEILLASAPHPDFEGVDAGAGGFEEALSEVGLQELQLGRPGGVVDLHHELAAVELDRLDVFGDGLTDGLVPTAEHASHGRHPAGGRGGGAAQ